MHNAVSILTPKRDRPSLHSFSIRDLLLVTLIVAILAAWWVDHRRQAGAIEQLNEDLKARHYFLTFYDQLNPPTSSAPAPRLPKE